MPRYFISKLVRDGFCDYPNIKALTTTLDDDLIVTALKEKLTEETAEVAAAPNKEALAAEIGDVLDVLDALINKSGLSLNDINAKRTQKTAEKGGFNKHIYAHAIELDEGHPMAKAFENVKVYPRLVPIEGDFYLGEAGLGHGGIDAILYNRIRAFNEKNGGASGDPFTFFMMHDKQVIGGISGKINHGVLLIYIMIIDDAYKNMGLGSMLLNRAENHGKAQGCTKAVVDTFAFQARPFYEKNGYTLEATVTGWWGPHERYYLFKML